MSSHATIAGGNVRRSKTSSQKLNPQDVLAIVLIAALALAPLPLGSNRPVFWALGALLTGGTAALYFGALAWRGEPIRVSRGWMGAGLALGLVYLGWIIVQILPLGTILGGFEVALPTGLVVQTDSLSLTPGAGILAALRVAGYGMLFALVLQIAGNRDRAKRFAQWLFFVVAGWAIYALMALVQFGDTILLFEKWAYLGSATGPFVNRNSFATFLAIGMIVGLGLSADRLTRGKADQMNSPKGLHDTGGALIARLTDTSMMHVYLLVLASLVVLATLFQTSSRMGVFAGLIGAGLTLTLILSRRLGLRRQALALVPVAMLVMGGLAAWFYGGVLFDRLGSVESAANVRFEVYRQVLGMIAQRPLSGWGADSFEVVYRTFRAPPVSLEFSWARAHSTYLAHWMETGVIFGSIPLLLVGSAFYMCFTTALRRESDIVLPAIGAGVITTGAIHSLVDFSLEIQAVTWFFIAVVALALGGHKSGATPVAPAPVPTPVPTTAPKRRKRRRHRS